MADLLKDIYTEKTLQEVANAFQAVYPAFPAKDFLTKTMDKTWEEQGIKARGRKISLSLGECLPDDYREAVKIVDQAAPSLSGGLLGLFVPDFVEVYGQAEEEWDITIQMLEKYTQYWSSEMAVRPLIIHQEERMMAQMNAWAQHENEHLRRLASEGCRPLLPWSQPLDGFKKDPTPVLQILEKLKADPSAYVRKSVANNLNDISKNQPELVIQLAKDWYGKNEGTDWVVKHGCRTLLKQAHPEVLAIFCYGDAELIEIWNFTIQTPVISIGEEVIFSFTIKAKEAMKIRLEYGVDYVKANGKRNRKVFKLSEINLKENKDKHYTRKHSLANVSVRKHYAGIHGLVLIINGVVMEEQDFQVLNK